MQVYLPSLFRLYIIIYKFGGVPMIQSRSVCSRIRNARASLDSAERNFRSNQEVRGELDLMLAEAELDNLRQKRPGFSWTRHVLAACVAVLLLASGCLGWWWASAYGGNTTNAAGLQGMSATGEQKEAATVTDKPAAAPSQSRTYAVSTAEEKPVKIDNSAVEKPIEASGMRQIENKSGGVRLSTNEMRRLIRSGKQELETVR